MTHEDDDDSISLNGHTGPAKFLKRLAYHERRAAAYRLVLDDLHQADRATKKKRAGHVIAQALKLEASRTKTTKKKAPGSWTAERRARRRKTAKLLATLSTTEPTKIPGTGIAVNLLRTGFIRKSGAGYVRTAKQFDADAK